MHTIAKILLIYNNESSSSQKIDALEVQMTLLFVL